MARPSKVERGEHLAGEQTHVVRLDRLRESPTNPRKHFGQLGELVQSIKARGILQPLVARPVGDELELVFGHRRLRASREAGLKEVPVLIREMSDAEVLEAQLIENSQREDINPLEEAEAYERLHNEFGRTTDQIAERVGKSRTWIYGRMKLLDLCPAVRKVFIGGKLNPLVALQIARIQDPRLQAQAADEVTKTNRTGEPMSVRGALQHLQRKYPLRDRELRQRAARTKKGAPGIAKGEREVAARLVLKVLSKAAQKATTSREFEAPELRLMLLALLAGGAPEPLLRRRGVDPGQLEAAIQKKLSSQDLRGLLLELCIARWVGDGSAGISDELRASAKALGMNLREMENLVRFELEQEAQKLEADLLFAVKR